LSASTLSTIWPLGIGSFCVIARATAGASSATITLNRTNEEILITAHRLRRF